ncbi:MAG TPA: hypothetical protein EYN51_02235 [Flavobacteriales bacterium]|nr:hypothetical protein [Flavobacteriales bacterium]
MAKFKKREKHTYEQQRVENDAVHQTGHNQSLYAYLAVFAFAFLLYSNTLNHDVALDDDVITKANRYVQQGLEGIPSIFSKGFYHGFNNVNEGSYRPLVLLNMAIEKEYWDNDPHVGHIFNVLFYALSCILVLAFLKALFKGQGSYNGYNITICCPSNSYRGSCKCKES